MLVRVYGHNATIDLFAHHLVITHAKSGVFFDSGADERFIPLSSIKAVQVSRPTFGTRGRIVLTLEGGTSNRAGTPSDPNTVFFDKDQVSHVQAILHAIQEAIATPSLEQLAMKAQRSRAQDTIGEGRPQPKPTRAVLERIEEPLQSYNPNTGADYRDTSSDGHFAYNHPGPPPSGGGGSWWSDMPLLGKIIVIGGILFIALVMCSKPGRTPRQRRPNKPRQPHPRRPPRRPTHRPT